MNVSSACASAVLFGALAATPASAMMSSGKGVSVPSSLVVKADFVAGHEAIGGIPARTAAARAQSAEMSTRYFDVDVAMTLGALALASGAFVAVGLAGARRRSAVVPAPSPREGWREEIMQALELDLLKFSSELREAA